MSAADAGPKRKKRPLALRMLAGSVAAGLVFVLTFSLVEGLASTAILVWDAMFNPTGDLPSRRHAELPRRGLTFINLRKPFRNVPRDTLEAMYYMQWGQHYSRRGHRRLAELLRQRLDSLGLGARPGPGADDPVAVDSASRPVAQVPGQPGRSEREGSGRRG